MSCILIAEFTSEFFQHHTLHTISFCLLTNLHFLVVGLMALKKGVVATPLMIPIIVITILFNGYVRKQHFRVSEVLPSRECLKTDLQNGPDFDLSFTHDAYLQDEMRCKVKYPENIAQHRLDAIFAKDDLDKSAMQQTS
jgi:hypothetical protein